MRTSLAFLALAATAFAVPQAVTENIAPKGKAPKGCTTSYDGQFEVTIFKPGNEKRDVTERSCNGEGVLVLNLKDGVLKDAQGRTGYISESYQFQFDNPVQAGAIYTSGFSVCSNGTLGFGPSAIFWQCQSGDFYNLYDRNWAEQCEPVEFGVMPCGKSKNAKSAPKKRIVGSSVVATTVVTVVSDGTTREVPTTIAVPMCQIGDGQVQVRTTPCDDMEIPIITAAPVSQVSDGKLQVPTTAPPAPPAVQKPAKPADDTPAEGTGGDAGDKPKPAGESKTAASPAGNAAPDNTGAAQADKPAGDEPSATGARQKSKATKTGDEVLVTDSGVPSDTETEEAGFSRSTRAVKPFKPQTTESDDSGETGSSSSTGSADAASTGAAQSDAFKIAASLGMVLVSGLFGSLLIL
ncbi:covalently-linked cell wall protein [Fusarium mexicanum]|uniref:Covalently-linked cell wall protein n=1 Tax=Fusarium mexicanum TaxID=751941 RepID=A0A8H5MNE3_9HYPO|nr:covalently-linked cell wall protein [Fusarium mexicanum]